jgi:hypothetical protein
MNNALHSLIVPGGAVPARLRFHPLAGAAQP